MSGHTAENEELADRPQGDAQVSQTVENDVPHNHVTRDIKPRGQCPGCDAYHDRRSAEDDATGWDHVPWNGVHEFRPWTVMHERDGNRWLAPGCTCGTIRSAGPRGESEASMRAWFDGHLATATRPIPPGNGEGSPS